MDSLFRRRFDFTMPSSPDAAAAQRRRQRHERRRAARQQPLPASDLVRGRFVPLIEEDRLLFRVVLDAPQSQAHARSLARHASQLGTTFRTAFGEVWDRIPLVDQVRMRSHWQLQDWPRLYPLSPAEKRLPRPVIEVVDRWHEEATETCGNYGGNLVFTAQLVTGASDRLRAMIVRALTQVHMYASREHYRLAVEVYEDPLAQWAKENSGYTSDAWQEKSDALHDEYVRQHQLAQAELRRRWRADHWLDEGTE